VLVGRASAQVEPKDGKRLQMVQKPETLLIRPFVVCAVLRGIKLDKTRYNRYVLRRPLCQSPRSRPPCSRHHPCWETILLRRLKNPSLKTHPVVRLLIVGRV
jgi:hypothetical protein